VRLVPIRCRATGRRDRKTGYSRSLVSPTTRPRRTISPAEVLPPQHRVDLPLTQPERVPPPKISRTLRLENLSAGIGDPAVSCRGSRSVDSIVSRNAVQTAIIGCPQLSECCAPSVGFRMNDSLEVEVLYQV
jgi:hypothetical protein